MKRVLAFACGFCLAGSVANAQTVESKYGVDSVKTIENASIYSEFLKQKNYDEALPAWSYVFHNAPAFQVNTYMKGEDLFSGLYKQTKNAAYLDSLKMVYDQWIKYSYINPRFGEGYILGKKGATLIQLGVADEQAMKEAYGYLTKSFEMEGAKSHPLVVQIMFYTAGDLMRKEILNREDYVNEYMKVSRYVDHALKNAKKTEPYQEMKGRIDGMFFSSGAADCGTLDRLLTAKYNSAPEDVENVKSIVSLLRRNECEELELYTTVTEQLYKMDPSGEAAYSLATMFMKRQDWEKADTYLQEAIAKAADNICKGDYCMRQAQLKLAKKQYAEAKRAALSAIQCNPKNGVAYILIGKAYAAYSSNYGEDAFDHASVFWAAVDKFNKAKQVEPALAAEVNSLINSYTPHFPSKDEAFFRSVTEGTTVKIGDWINETTTARFTK